MLIKDVCAHLVKTVDTLAQLCTPDNVQLSSVVNSGLAKGDSLGIVPSWALDMHDYRSNLAWDSEQYIAPVALNNGLTLGVVDTGSCKTLVCKKTAVKMGLPVQWAKQGEFGTYRTPGGTLKCYVGMIEGPLNIRFGDKVAFAA